MNVLFERSFLQDLKKDKSPDMKKRAQKAITEMEQAKSIRDITNLKQLKTPASKTTPLTLYRKRLGNYRLGFAYDAKTKTIICTRIGHRKDIYSSWP